MTSELVVVVRSSLDSHNGFNAIFPWFKAKLHCSNNENDNITTQREHILLVKWACVYSAWSNSTNIMRSFCVVIVIIFVITAVWLAVYSYMYMGIRLALWFSFLAFHLCGPDSNPTSDWSLACGLGFQSLPDCMGFPPPSEAIDPLHARHARRLMPRSPCWWSIGLRVNAASPKNLHFNE